MKRKHLLLTWMALLSLPLSATNNESNSTSGYFNYTAQRIYINKADNNFIKWNYGNNTFKDYMPSNFILENDYVKIILGKYKEEQSNDNTDITTNKWDASIDFLLKDGGANLRVTENNPVFAIKFSALDNVAAKTKAEEYMQFFWTNPETQNVEVMNCKQGMESCNTTSGSNTNMITFILKPTLTEATKSHHLDVMK